MNLKTWSSLSQSDKDSWDKITQSGKDAILYSCPMAAASSVFSLNLLSLPHLGLLPRARQTGRRARSIKKEQEGSHTSYSIDSDPTRITADKLTW